MFKLWKHLKPYTLLLLVMLGLVYGQTAANLALPDYMAKIVNQGIVGQNLSLVWQTGLIMLLVTLAGGICTVGVGFLAARVATGFSTRLREDVFERVEDFSLQEFNQFSTASLITRCTNDIQQIQMVMVMVLRMALMAPFLGIGAIIKAYGLAPSMTWLMAVAIGVLVTIIAVLFTVALPRFHRLQKLVDKLNLITREILTGLRVIRAFNKEGYEERKFAQGNQDLTDVNLFVNRLMAVMQPSMMLVLNFTSLAIVWVGAHAIESNILQIGDMLAFMQYAMQAIFSFLMISIMFILVPRAAVSVRRIIEVLSAEPAIRDPQQAREVSGHSGSVEFRDVTFIYPGAEEPALQNVSFTAMPGQTTAFVGSTGSGKSTLVSLIPRFYDVTGGQILIDGVDVREMNQADLRARLGFVPQKAVLFSGTVASNISYGNDQASVDDIERAAGIAQASEFIEQLDEKFDHPIAQGGQNVSGGQKQRLAIARALARNAEVYVLDDSFSALDFKTDATLRKALTEQMHGKTVLIVAQRISSVMQADKIVVLEGGKVVGQGTHQELLRDCAVYQEIASSQLSAEELGKTQKPVVEPVGGMEGAVA